MVPSAFSSSGIGVVNLWVMDVFPAKDMYSTGESNVVSRYGRILGLIRLVSEPVSIKNLNFVLLKVRFIKGLFVLEANLQNLPLDEFG